MTATDLITPAGRPSGLLVTRDLPAGALPVNHHAPGCPHRPCPAGTVITACPTHGIRCRLRGLTTPTGDCGCGCTCPTGCVPAAGHLTLPRLHRLLAVAYRAAGDHRLADMYAQVPAWRVIAAQNAPVAIAHWQLHAPETRSVPLPASVHPARCTPTRKEHPPVRIVYSILAVLLIMTGLTALGRWILIDSAYTWQGVAYAATAAVTLFFGALLVMLLASASPGRDGATVTRPKEATIRFRRRQRVVPPPGQTPPVS